MKQEADKLIELHKAILQDPEINSLNELKRKILEVHTPKYLANLETNTASAITDEDLEHRLSKVDLWIKERIETIKQYYS
jgi:uncharacterized protein YPO0396